jgi:beta-lactamase class A
LLVSSLVAVTLPLTACAGPTRAPAPAAHATAPSATPQIPHSSVGDQLRWFLDADTRLPISARELSEHLSADFLAQVPPNRFNAAFASVPGIRLGKLTDVTPTHILGLVTAAGQSFTITIMVDLHGKINSLLLSPLHQPTAPPASWSELDRRLRKLAPDVSFLAAEVNGTSCRPVHAIAADTPRPLGSMFKLYVLEALAEKIRAGQLSWDTTLTIKPELKSLFGGQLQDRPDNSTVKVADAADLMISVSDNTAADLLIDKVGRRAVEAQVRRLSRHAGLDVPFLTTRELFELKGVDYPHQARRYLSLGTEGRRAFLDRALAGAPRSKIKLWTSPRDIRTLEWFASPADICRTFADLKTSADPGVGRAMSINDGGLALSHKDWPAVWFKGGSEPGVLDLSFLARSATGKTYVVTTLTSDPRTAFDEGRNIPELISLVRGAFGLLG